MRYKTAGMYAPKNLKSNTDAAQPTGTSMNSTATHDFQEFSLEAANPWAKATGVTANTEIKQSASLSAHGALLSTLHVSKPAIKEVATTTSKILLPIMIYMPNIRPICTGARCRANLSKSSQG